MLHRAPTVGRAPNQTAGQMTECVVCVCMQSKKKNQTNKARGDLSRGRQKCKPHHGNELGVQDDVIKADFIRRLITLMKSECVAMTEVCLLMYQKPVSHWVF